MTHKCLLTGADGFLGTTLSSKLLENNYKVFDINTIYGKFLDITNPFVLNTDTQFDVVLSILRIPLIAGPKPPGNLGAMINGIKTGRYLSIGKADARKSIVWAEDIAQIIPKLAEVGGVYNLTDGYYPSFGELEKTISIVHGKSNPFKIPMYLAKMIARVGDFLGSKSPINTNKLNKITFALIFDDSLASEKLRWNPTKILVRISEIV